MTTIKLTSNTDASEPDLGHYYRYMEIRYAAPLNEYDEPQGRGRLEVVLLTYPVIKRTPKGAWIHADGERKFVLTSANKRFACATLEEAQDSYVHRKRKQIAIYQSRMKGAEEALMVFSTMFPVLQRLSPGARLMTLSEYRELANNGLARAAHGVGYFATTEGRSELKAGWFSTPQWATHVEWHAAPTPSI